MFASGKWVWNPGYWIVDLDFTLSLYEKYMPKMYKKLQIIAQSLGTVNETRTIRRIYPTLEQISFDNAIMEKLPPEDAVLITPSMEWSDPGTLYALKDALTEKTIDNFERGKVVNLNSQDCLVVNEEKQKLLTTIGLKGMIIVNTPDAIIAVHKDNVPQVKELVKLLEKDKALKKYV